jgi:tetratricopeptide (TPR) repeat protein
VALAEKQGNGFMVAAFHSHKAILRLMIGDDATASQLATAALNERVKLGLDALITDNLGVLALAHARLGQPDQALEYASRATQILDATGGEGPENSTQDYLFCYQALALLQQGEKARHALASALKLVQESAARIVEPHIRQSYLENVPACRQVLAEAKKLGL